MNEIEESICNEIVGVRFRRRGKIYTFESAGIVLEKNEKVIVDTENGPAIGTVASMVRISLQSDLPENLKRVIRKADESDLTTEKENFEIEKEAFLFCRRKIGERNLPMRLVEVSYLFDRSKLIFYFTAESRVDFRELVKDLVAKYRTRIELRQIWVRSEAKIFGGIGMCGRELCCVSFLNNFVPVSIKMAKEQNMLLNPEKISGLCGRLMCCLAYEYDDYREAKKNMPKVGKNVEIPQGKGKVIRQNVIEEKIVVATGEGKEFEIFVDEIIAKQGKDTH
ncbi:MAG: stage 0 sporulation family protein [Syntrophales bacterium]|jgi:cell fate regulator YaaT (PSP1 superfamily)|nr:stage 0 sporulation family protein [Syntrophales bacterium]MDY0043373.1 stage 0 sporulation family protein [Syntrophales bacterium]